MPLEVAYSTIAAGAIAGVVDADYAVGPIVSCHLFQRGFNDTYELVATGGAKYMVRLSGLRPRGPANIAYEVAFLAHLRGCGLKVACAVAGRDGRPWRELAAPEGTRTFAVFEHLVGDPLSPARASKLDDDLIEDVRLIGAELARLHTAGETYSGPPSRYRLEGDYLLARPVGQLLAAPKLDESQRQAISEFGATLADRLADVEARLTRVACHGDNHGGNTMISGERGERVAAWFDFDDCGPGFLAYDLAVFLWQMLGAINSAALNADGQTCWTAFLGGYRSNRSIQDADFEAIALFVPIRHLLWMSEIVGRVAQNGVRVLSSEWLGPQLALVRGWKALVTPSA